MDNSDVVPRTQTPTPARERSAAAFRIDGNAAATLSCNTLTVSCRDGAGHLSSTTSRLLPRAVFVCRARNLLKTRPTHSLSSLFSNGRLCRWSKLRAMDEKSYLPGKQFLVPYLAEAKGEGLLDAAKAIILYLGATRVIDQASHRRRLVQPLLCEARQLCADASFVISIHIEKRHRTRHIHAAT